jgi:O-methyltransferase
MAIGTDKAAALQALAASVAEIAGDAAEAGVWQGGSLALIAKALPGKTVLGFDTFAGMPLQAWQFGEDHQPGDFDDTSLEAVTCSLADLPNVILVPGLFPASAGVHHERRFAFAHLDLDFYQSTRDALGWFLPRMTTGGLIVLDDYGWQRCPGVAHAIEEADLEVFATAPYQVAIRV